MTYPVHPNAEPPFPETSPCFVCGLAKGHDLTKHIDPSLGRRVCSCVGGGYNLKHSLTGLCFRCHGTQVEYRTDSAPVDGSTKQTNLSGPATAMAEAIGVPQRCDVAAMSKPPQRCVRENGHIGAHLYSRSIGGKDR